MKVLFLRDVPTVARAGEIKDVSNGYWRNYLLPKKFAQAATEKNITEAYERRKRETKQKEVESQTYQALRDKLENFTLTITAKTSSEGKLFGGIGAQTIADKLKSSGLVVEASMIALEHSLKEVGPHTLLIKLPLGLRANLRLVIQAEK